MITKKEARGYTRSDMRLRGEVRMDSGIYLEGETHNVSLSGVWFSMERSLPMGHPVRMNLVLEQTEQPQRISLQGYVSRIDEGGVAIAFTGMDADSREKLRALVQYTTGKTGSV